MYVNNLNLIPKCLFKFKSFEPLLLVKPFEYQKYEIKNQYFC